MVDTAGQTRDKLQIVLTATLLSLAILLGGGQGGLGDTFLQLLALALLAYLFLKPGPSGRRLLSLPGLAWLPLIILALPLVQMLPMPASLWTGLDGRAPLVSQLAAVGLVPSPRLALQELGAERALWSLLPGVALYLSSLTLPSARQRQLLGLILLLSLASLIMGLLQVAQGTDSALYFYTNTNRGAAVGFFANRNHLAALLLMAMPLALASAAYAISQRTSGKRIGVLPVVAAVGLAVVLILGIAMTRSRAGLLFGMLGLLLSVPMVLALRRGRGVKRVFAVIVALALVLTVQFALYGILQRLEADPLGDQRWQIAGVTIEAAKQNAPIGSGLGTFRQVYQAVDTKAPGRAIVNHAHNDYLELWLEAGWLFIGLATVFIGTILWAAVAAWRSTDGRSSLWAKAASISLLLMLLHSVLDYPLRTSSNQAVFAVLLAVLLSKRKLASEGRHLQVEKGSL